MTYFVYMGDNIMRHLVAATAVAMCLLAYYAGYFSGQRHWWWSVFALLIIYGGVYKLVDK